MLLIAAVTLSAGGIGGKGCTRSKSDEASSVRAMGLNEVAVYEACIREASVDRVIAVVASSSIPEEKFPDLKRAQTFEIEGVSDATIQDFKRKGEEHRRLDYAFKDLEGVVVLSKDEARSFLTGESKWSGLAEEFQGASEIWRFSPIGFGADERQALVLIERYPSPRSGIIYLAFMEWEGVEGWVERKRQILLIGG